MILQDDLDYLRTHLDFWDKLQADQKSALESSVSTVTYAKGAELRSRDSECLGVLLLKKGALRAFIRSEDGREVTLYRLGPGELCIFSASCVLNSLHFDVSIDADEDTEAIRIHTGLFDRLVRENVWVENISYKNAVEKFGDIMWAFEQVLFMRFDTRLAIFLLDESAKSPDALISATHDQIAKYVGSAREVVSRMLKNFESKKLVELSRGSIKVISREGLRTLL
ncbi:MAG: Crp/Fnr family transcriptional regulator [Treponema sp.]|jgi:CRP/FNR family transcriptional regulator|nr:MAG: DNA-binding transcriptional dual regulator Crp [Spirochaetes bacterium ADurb.Bin269]TAH47706.1 MAG: Crp/Fnr family transcriptional regulator [Treponema sp.]HPX48630.1 Crp/Fnr family transcriptional regulator [Treponemataceae bacterium]HQL32752.1 Crp/Fnr family transcriptional regulator [Treponemataceae bacterium]